MAASPSAGLCASCRHGKALRTKSGAALYLCGMAGEDPRYPKYPRLPVLRCGAYGARDC